MDPKHQIYSFDKVTQNSLISSSFIDLDDYIFYMRLSFSSFGRLRVCTHEAFLSGIDNDAVWVTGLD